MTRKRGRHLSDDEQTLWEGVARSIKPLRPVKKVAAAAPAGPEKPATRRTSEQRALPRPAPPPPPPPRSKPLTELDRRTRQKLVRGREAIDARLDLHGMTQLEAYAALSRFLFRAQADGMKFVLVVTGKGVRGDGETRGVLRRQVPLWLALPEFRELVIGFDAAHVGHGGEGALYVRVRRRR
jgi:DNA-nicking Smr family endonuclease